MHQQDTHKDTHTHYCNGDFFCDLFNGDLFNGDFFCDLFNGDFFCDLFRVFGDWYVVIKHTTVMVTISECLVTGMWWSWCEDGQNDFKMTFTPPDQDSTDHKLAQRPWRHRSEHWQQCAALPMTCKVSTQVYAAPLEHHAPHLPQQPVVTNEPQWLPSTPL